MGLRSVGRGLKRPDGTGVAKLRYEIPRRLLTTRTERERQMVNTDAAIYGRNRRASVRFFWVAVAVFVGASAAFFVRTGLADGDWHVVPTNLYPVLLAFVVLVAMASAVANAYLKGSFAISVLNATAVALAFGLATLLSQATGTGVEADAPQVLVFATFAGIAAFGGLLAWG
jgi:hypothetical protein